MNGLGSVAGMLAVPLLFFLSLIAGSCADNGAAGSAPRAVRGVVDLRSWDFERDGQVSLSGLWEFHWGRFLDPRSPGVPETGAAGYAYVPGAWNDGGEHPPFGFATYRLRVLLSGTGVSLGLKFLDMGTAYRVFVNGVEVHAAGSPGTSRDTSMPRYNPGAVTFTPGVDELDIVIHVSNYHHRKGGAWDRILLGAALSIVGSREGSIAFELFLFGCFLIIGMYHLVLFALRKRDRSPLYFGLYCLCISVFTITTGERFIVRAFPILSWEIHFRLIMLSIFASVPLFGLFLRSLFPGEFSDRFRRFLVLAGAAFCGIALLLPASLNVHALVYFQVLILAACLYALVVLVMSLARKREGSGVFLVSIVVLFAAAVNDILHDNDVINTGFFIPMGFLVFVFSHSFILSRRFSRAFFTVERQSAKLAEMRYYLQNIIDSMPSVLVGVDTEGRITEWNIGAGEITGLMRGDVEGRPLGDVFPLLEKHLDKVRAAIRERRAQSTERVIHMDNGEVRYSDVMVYPLIANGVEGVVIRVDDVTSRVQIEEMMIQTEKMMSVGGLAAGMAHEINNPLGAILLSVQNIRRRLSSDLARNADVASDCGVGLDGVIRYMEKREIAKMLGEIAEMGERAAKIVSDMLTFSRKSGEAKVRGDLRVIAEKALELAAKDYDLKKHYDFRHIEILREYGDAPGIICIPMELEQVFLNLLKNAAHAMADAGTENPRITIRIRNDGDYVHLELGDNGPGMDGETCRRAFEPFFTTKGPGVGTGLGLSVSYYIITKNHGGTMTVESTPGNGAKFIINLPAG